MTRPLCICLVALLFAGCATTHLDLTGITAQQIVSTIENQSQLFQRFSSSGYGDFETPRGDYSARFEISIQKPSITHVRVYGPLGIKVAQVELSADTLILYNSMRNEVYIGKPTEANLRQYLMVAADGTSLNTILLGLMMPVAHLQNSQDVSHVDGNTVTFTYITGDTVEKYTVDGEYMRTTGYEQSIRGEVVIEIKYSDFKSVGNVYFPRTVSLRDLKHGISAKLFYQDIALDEKDETEFIVPTDAKKVYLN